MVASGRGDGSFAAHDRRHSRGRGNPEAFELGSQGL